MKSALLFGLLLITHALNAQTANYEGIRKINGADLYLRIQGKGEPLVVVHGGPGLNHAYFRPYLDNLSKKFKLVYYDQRACGKSATPRSDSIAMKFFVDDIEAIRKYLNTEKINLLSHSWGSVLATQYGIAYPNRVAKIVYSNPSPLNRDYDDQMSRTLKQNTTRDDSLTRAEILSEGNFNSENMERLFKISFRTSAYNPDNIEKLHFDLPPNFATANRALFTKLSKDLAAYDYYDEAKAFNFPVLIIHGAADGIPYESVTRLKETIPGARVEIFEKSGHFPFVEEEKKFEEVVREFVSE